jgi:hypothetical protein
VELVAAGKTELSAAVVGKVLLAADVSGMRLFSVVVASELLTAVDVGGIRVTSVVADGGPEPSAVEFVGSKLLACGAELSARVLVGRELLLLVVVMILPSMSVDVTDSTGSSSVVILFILRRNLNAQDRQELT